MRKYKRMSLRAFRKALSETESTRYLVTDDNYRSLLVFVLNVVAQRAKSAEANGLELSAISHWQSWNHLIDVVEKYEADWNEEGK